MRTLFREAIKPESTERIDKKGWIKWGDDNLYAQFLIGIYYDNPIHGGVINQKVKFISAGGYTIEGGGEELLKFSNGGDLQKVIDITTLDQEIGETYCIKFKKSAVDNLWYAEPIDFELVRCTENLVYYAYSEDWSKSIQTPEKTGFKEIKNIHYITSEDTECILTNITRPKQRKHAKSNLLTASYYPVVNYSGAITSILAGIEMDFFTFSEVVNSFKGGTLINLSNGLPENEQEEDKIVKRVKGEASNRETQGGMVVTFSDGKERAPIVEQLNGNDLDKRYLESNKEVVKKIMIAHGVISPTLFGVMSDTMFGSKEEMELAYILFQENYVRVRQRNISEPLTWAFKKLNGFQGNIVFNDYDLQFEKQANENSIVGASLNAMSPVVANKVLTSLTINEIRALANLGGIPNGDVIPTAGAFSEMKPEDDIVSLFESVGVSRDSMQILSSREYDYSDNEDEFLSAFDKSLFATITDEQKTILKMIKNGESWQAVNEAIGKGGAYLSSEIVKLGTSGYVDGWKLTDKGKANVATKAEVQVHYSYDKKASAPDLVKGGKSRPFCAKLIELDKLYTRQEIETISGAIGRDVWTYRGGWYHNPGTDVNTPSCRHIWNQHITVNF